MNGVLLKPLPFEDPDELVSVLNRVGAGGGYALSTDQYFTYRDENRVFEDIGVFYNAEFTVTGLEEPELVRATQVTAGLLPLLRVQPVIGRLFTEEDDSPGAAWTIMLSYAYWQRQFGADPAAVRLTCPLCISDLKRKRAFVLYISDARVSDKAAPQRGRPGR